jgi:hypothetical protein
MTTITYRHSKLRPTDNRNIRIVIIIITQHNERAEWIRREQKRKISLMDWRPIQISEIALYLLKAHNWKYPGNDQIQNYWLKAFPAIHRHITKNFYVK